jgi:hypothetical protein
MGTVHRLIQEHGLEAARQWAETDNDRRVVEAAAAILAEEQSRLAITHAGFALTSLPHKKIADTVWERKGHLTTLLVESGLDRNRKPIGITHGPLARLILIYLQSEAIRTGSPEVILGKSMNNWLIRMGIAKGGKSRLLVMEQAKRISACRLTFFTDLGPTGESRSNGAFVRDTISMAGVIDDSHPTLWQDRVRLDEGFWASLREHPIPVREEAIRAIGAKSMAMDIYIWLSYRLHALSKVTPVSWPAIYSQFGTGFARTRAAKPAFIEALQIALAVYPEAKVDVEDDGIVMHPSPPAVPKTEARRLGM